jgi:hypothetical protein
MGMRYYVVFCILVAVVAIAFFLHMRIDVDATEPNAICEIHGIKLQSDIVPITYGLRRFTNEERNAHRLSFPHASSEYNEGCMDKGARRARVSFCPSCRKAESQWKAQHWGGAR